MNAVVVLVWEFSPPDYFETTIEISKDDYTMTIADGKAEAKIDSEVFDSNPSMRAALHNALNDQFLAFQLFSNREYDLPGSKIIRGHPDGLKEYILECGTATFKLTGGAVDFKKWDKDGNVVVDTKRDRIEKKKHLADLISRHQADDKALGLLLQSYYASRRDPNNELVHLYEIRGALSSKFGGKKKVESALKISSSDWDCFGRLCNHEPLRQGRHRGENYGTLRDATEAELTEARRIARIMIEAYLRHIDTTVLSSGA